MRLFGRNRKFLFLIVLLVIGFASVSATLVINGTIGIGVNTEDFNVVFVDGLLNGETSPNITISDNKKTLTFDTDVMTTIGDTQEIQYSIKNNATHYAANVSISCTVEENEYIKVSGSLDNHAMPITDKIRFEPQEVKSGIINVEMKKSYAGETEASFPVTCNIVAEAVDGEYIGIVKTSTTTTTSKPYNVEFINYGNTYTRRYVEKGKKYGTLPTLTSPGSTFLGWYTEEFGGNQIKEESIFNSDTLVKLYAHWGVNTYTISLNSNGGVLEESNSKVYRRYYQKYGDLPEPTKAGYLFAGWYTKVADGSFIEPDIEVRRARDHTLYARWCTKKYTVTFDANGGNPVSHTKDVANTGLYGILPETFKEGYYFTGWYTEPEGGDEINSDTKVTITENQTLYAHWEKTTYYVKFNANGGTTPSFKTKAIATGLPYGELPTTTRLGYTFTGWYTEDGTKVEETTTVDDAHNHELYAHWAANALIINYDPNGGELEATTGSMFYGDLYGDLPVPTKFEHKFVGWFTELEGGTQVKKGEIVKLNSGDILYAHWTVVKCTVTFNVDGGTVTPGTKEVTYKGKYGELPTPTKEGENFSGWYTALKKGTEVTSETIVDNEENHTLYATWEEKYTISFDANGGTPVDRTIKIIQGAKFGELPTSERSGYDFLGWFTEKDGGTQITKDSTLDVKENKTFYAHWKIKKYTVSFDANGGDEITETKEVIYGSKYGTLPTPTIEGYNFSGWYTEVNEGTKVDEDTDVTTAKNHTLYAHWSPKKFTISFNANGGDEMTETKEVSYGGAYGTLPTPTREGYDFLGWYTKATEGTKVDKDTVVTLKENQTLYAHWNIKKLTVSYDANGGDDITETKQVTYGSKYGDLPTPNKPGYTFDGWYTEVTDGTKVDKDTQVTITENQTLYAHWNGASYTVTFDANSGKTPSFASKKLQTGDKYGDLPTIEKDGYTFDGWFTDKTNGTKIESTTRTTIKADQTLYAHWTVKTYKIQYNYVSGTAGTNHPDNGTYDTVVTISNPTRTGYNFDGWTVTSGLNTSTAKYGTSSANVTSSISSSTTKVKAEYFKNISTGEDVTLKANWTIKTFTISFDANEGNAVTSTLTVTYGGKYGDSIPKATRKGYTFDGWYTAKTEGTKVDKDTDVTLDSNQTLYAHWTANKYTVTLKANGGKFKIKTTDENGEETEIETTDDQTKEVTYDTKYGEFPTVTKPGNKFLGWYTAEENGEAVTSDKIVKEANNQTLYARWEVIIYTITYDAIDGTPPSPATKSIKYGEAYGEFPETTKEGYILEGWYTEKDGGDKIEETSIFNLESDQTLYVHWAEPVFNVSFDANGGDEITEVHTVTYNQTYGWLPTPTYQNPFVTFEGWFTDPIGGEQIRDGDTVTITSDITLYAHYSGGDPSRDPGQVITFQTDRGSFDDGTQTYSETIYKDQMVSFPWLSEVYIPDSTIAYRFLYWMDYDTGMQTSQYTAYEQLVESKTFVAVWEEFDICQNDPMSHQDLCKEQICSMNPEMYPDLCSEQICSMNPTMYPDLCRDQICSSSPEMYPDICGY